MCKSSKALTWCGCLFSYEVIFVYSIYGGHPAWLMHHGPRLLHLDKAQIILMPSLPFCGYCCIISVIHSVNNVRYSSQPLAIQLDRCLFTCTCAYLMPASCFSQSRKSCSLVWHFTCCSRILHNPTSRPSRPEKERHNAVNDMIERQDKAHV